MNERLCQPWGPACWFTPTPLLCVFVVMCALGCLWAGCFRLAEIPCLCAPGWVRRALRESCLPPFPPAGGLSWLCGGGWVLRVHLLDGGPLPWVGALIAIPPLRSVGFRFSFCCVASSPLSVCLPLAGPCYVGTVHVCLACLFCCPVLYERETVCD